jgi:hypothetical protein
VSIDFKQEIAQMRDNLYQQKQNFGRNTSHKGLTGTELETETFGDRQPSPATSKTLPTRHQHQLGDGLVVPPVGFAQEFALMKKLIGSFQNKLQSQD